MTALAAPIARMIEATNAGDTEAFLDCFTPDAYLEDWGRGFTGRDGIASWNRTDNIGKNAHFEAIGVTGDDTHQVVTIVVTGGGYNGTGPIEFEMRDDLISRLVISAD
jgi:hypothetical protein